MAMGKGRAAAVVLTAVLGLALVAVCLHDEPTGAGGVAVLESSGKEPTEKSVEARIRSAHLLLRRRLAAGLAQERGRASLADSAASEVDVYFGGGCFWHMQHAFVQAERKYLGRTDNQLTSVAGYAGARQTGPNGRVCYHNALARDSDYGRLGFAEAVQVAVPEGQMVQFADSFFERFHGGVRHDPQDTGGEYRSVLGLPGGITSRFIADFKVAAERAGMKLEAGTGGEGDTLAAKTVLVYDTAALPFHQAEAAHQFHDDMSAAYGQPYNALRQLALKDGLIHETTCPLDSSLLGSLLSI